MLDPKNRGALLEALRPPPGFSVDAAIATTYSLDLLALLTAPLAFSLYDRLASNESKAEVSQLDSLALLEAVRRHAERLVVFCHGGAIAVPKAYRQVTTYVEDCVVQARARAEGGVFHPKLWVQRLTCANAPVRYRILVNSRNLTFDRCWDTMLVLDGELKERKTSIVESKPLSEFVAALPSLALDPSAFQGPRRALLEQIAEELRRVEYEKPEHVESLTFWPMGHDGRVREPFPDQLGKTLVISPFLATARLESLLERAGAISLVSRADELDKVPLATLSRFSEVSVLNDAAEDPEESDEPEVVSSGLPPARGLHAKLYVTDQGRDASLWTGSANASRAAFSQNVELLVQLSGKKSKLGVETFFQGGKDGEGLRSLLVPYQRESDDCLPSQEDLTLQQLLRRETEALVAAGWTTRLVIDAGTAPPRETYSFSVEPQKPWTPGAGCSVSVWPISLPRERASALQAGAPVVFERCSFQAITPFLAFEVRHQDSGETAVVVIKATLDGAPANRGARVLQSMLDDPAKVLRFLRMLLATEIEEALALLDDGDTDGHAASGGSQPEVPLFETLTRAFDRSPEKLEHVDRLMRELRSSEGGEQLVPPGFDTVWQPLWAAYQSTLRTASEKP
jgi:hypothetical protein